MQKKKKKKKKKNEKKKIHRGDFFFNTPNLNCDFHGPINFIVFMLASSDLGFPKVRLFSTNITDCNKISAFCLKMIIFSAYRDTENLKT